MYLSPIAEVKFPMVCNLGGYDLTPQNSLLIN